MLRSKQSQILVIPFLTASLELILQVSRKGDQLELHRSASLDQRPLTQ